MATTPSPLPMFGVWNEHWKNHPAGLPISKYKGNTNPNTGATSVDKADELWRKAQGESTTPPPATTPVPTPAQPATPWNQWYVDWQGAPPANPGAPVQPTPVSPTAATSLSEQYTPAMREQLYENPWYAIEDIFQGVNTASPLYQALRDMGGDPVALYNIIRGSQSGIDGGSADYADWLGSMYQGQGSVGGQGFNAQDLLSALFSQEKFGADADNVLGQILGAGDMSTQIRTLYNLARDASNVGMNPLAARAYQSALAQAGDRYGQAMLAAEPGGAGPQNPAAWLRANAPWLAMGGS